jgi:hypothetical protein
MGLTVKVSIVAVSVVLALAIKSRNDAGAADEN